MAVIEIDRVGLPERYEPVSHVASGGMASVWCADDRLLGRRVAIKLLAECFQSDGTAHARFLREARVAALLSNHPHVITIYDVGEAAGRAFIVMEYLAGGSVGDALKHRVVSRDEAVRWLRSAAEALDYAHGQGVIHRDVKPSNLLLDPDGSLRVADFGIARMTSEEPITMAGHILGSAGYLAPEQIQGEPATDASDRYAFAVTASELLTGHRAMIEPIRRPTPLGEVLRKGATELPEQRWESCVEMVDAIEDAIAGARTRTLTRPQPAAAAVAVAPTRMTTSRARVLAALAAFAFALGAAFGAVHGSGKTVKAASARGARAPKIGAGKAGAPTQASQGAPGRTAATAATTPTTATTTPTVANSSNADTLEALGHQLMRSGSYAAAIATLRSAVASSDPASLTHAYALYDLGRTLRLSGNPHAAIPILEQRLRIPNQTPAVQQELNLALAAAGQAPVAGRDLPPGKAKKHKGPGPAKAD